MLNTFDDDDIGDMQNMYEDRYLRYMVYRESSYGHCIIYGDRVSGVFALGYNLILWGICVDGGVGIIILIFLYEWRGTGIMYSID